MGFEYSDTTKRIREAHNQKGRMGRILDPLTNCERKKHFRKKKLQERDCLQKKFEILFGEQFISIISLIGDRPKEAVYLTIEYIYRILELAPPMAQNKGEEHRKIYTLFCERGQREMEKNAYNMFIWGENKDLKNKEPSCKQRKKPLNKRELKRVYEKFPFLKPKRPISYSDYRKHIFWRMQDCFDRLFGIWVGMEGGAKYIQTFTQKISEDICKGIKKPRKFNQCDERIYSYVVQYLKSIAQQEIKNKKLRSLEIKDYYWNKEWKEELREFPQDYEKLRFMESAIPSRVLNPENSKSAVCKHLRYPEETYRGLCKFLKIPEKSYLGNNKEFEKEFKKYLKEIREEYLNNSQNNQK